MGSLVDLAAWRRQRTTGEGPVEGDLGTSTAGDAYERVVRLLGRSDRSAADLLAELRSEGWSDHDAAVAVSRAESEGYCDDARFSARLVERALRASPRSASAVARDLRSHGVSETIVQTTIEPLRDGEEERAREVCAKYSPRYAGLPRDVRERRLMAVLLRRGFSSEMSRRTVAGCWSESS